MAIKQIADYSFHITFSPGLEHLPYHVACSDCPYEHTASDASAAEVACRVHIGMCPDTYNKHDEWRVACDTEVACNV